MKFYYYYDEKVTVWKRNHFSIEAENQEEANAIAIENMIEPWEIEIDETEYLFDTDGELSPENNDGRSTIELYSKANEFEPLYENGK